MDPHGVPLISVFPGTTVQVPNVGAPGHNFQVKHLGIHVDMPPGETMTITIPTDAKPGLYEFICTIQGHEQAGMVETLVVR